MKGLGAIDGGLRLFLAVCTSSFGGIQETPSGLSLSHHEDVMKGEQ